MLASWVLLAAALQRWLSWDRRRPPGQISPKKRAELMFVGSAGFFTRCEPHPPDETPNELVRNANIKHQPRCLSCDQYGIRSVGVRCAQSSRTRLECFDFYRRLLLERRSWFHPRPHASLRFLRLGVKHMQPPPPSRGIMWKTRRAWGMNESFMCGWDGWSIFKPEGVLELVSNYRF